MSDMRMNGHGQDANERKKRLLLVVDGDTSQLYYTGILLQRLEYTVYPIKTAEEALEIMGITMPSLVLTEAKLPHMSGQDFLRAIKQNPRLRSIPVIMYSGATTPACIKDCEADGCAAYLAKPLDADALYAAIQKATETTPRNYVRVKTSLRVIVGADKAAAEARGNEFITALSENGMYVSTTTPLPAGTRIPMIIFLQDRPVSVECLVLYSFTNNTGPLRMPGMGIKFVHIDPSDKELIRSFIGKGITNNIVDAERAGG